MAALPKNLPDIMREFARVYAAEGAEAAVAAVYTRGRTTGYTAWRRGQRPPQAPDEVRAEARELCGDLWCEEAMCKGMLKPAQRLKRARVLLFLRDLGWSYGRIGSVTGASWEAARDRVRAARKELG